MAYIESSSNKQPSLFSAIVISVGCIIGSGWFLPVIKSIQVCWSSCYGLMGRWCTIILLIALLLAEIATYYQRKLVYLPDC